MGFGGDKRSSKECKAALRRGDACLACRKRRIKCTAEKPVCATCARLNKTCTYDEARKPSQLSKLRDRVAELESQVQDAARPNQNENQTQDESTRVSETEAHLSFEFAQPSTVPSPPFFTRDRSSGKNHLNLSPAATHAPTGPPAHAMPLPQPLQPPPPQPYISPVAQSTNPRPLQPPDDNFAFNFGILDSAMIDLSTVLDASSPFAGRPTTTFPPQPHSGGYTGNTDSTGGSSKTCVINSGTSGSVDTSSTPYLNDPVASGFADDARSNVSGGWFDPDDVPPAVRDHLLDLFFSCKDVYEALFNIPRFYLRLTLPISRRPHPALLYTMYTIAARASTQPSLKALENRFFDIAQKRVYQGCNDGDRILDITKTFVLMTGYTYSVGRYNLGYVMAGSAIRMALCAGLHRIPSSVWVMPRKPNDIIRISLRTGIHALEPPGDPIELAERINTFWAVFELDQCTSIAYLWDPGLHTGDIITPFPRPHEDYASGLVSTADDIRLDSLSDLDAPKDQFQHGDFLTLRLKALALLGHVTRMRALPPELGCLGVRDPYHPHHLDRLSAGPRSAWESTPTAFRKMKALLDRFCSQLPAEYQPPWGQWDAGAFEPLPLKKVGKHTAIIWFLIASAYLQLWSVRSMIEENATAVLIGRRFVQVIESYTGEKMYGGFDTFVMYMWNDVAMTLLIEVKRLQILGRGEEEILELQRDTALVMDRMMARQREWGGGRLHVMDRLMARQSEWGEGRLHAGAMHVQVLEKMWNTSTEDWLEAMAESG